MRQIQRSAVARHSIALLASAVSSSIAFAQQPPTPPARQGPPRPAASAPAPQRQAGAPGARQARGGRGAPDARGGQPGPRGGVAGMLLAMRAQLELTDDQVRKLEALRNAPHPKPNAAEMLRAREAHRPIVETRRSGVSQCGDSRARQRATATAAMRRISASTSRRSSTSPGECE